MNHDLKIILSSGMGDTNAVVRWCRKCGAVVADLDHDGRTNAGYYRKMELPEVSKSKCPCSSMDRATAFEAAG